MESLPIEILDNILSRLPSLSTLQCKPVCKTWRKLIGKSKVGMLFALRQENEGEVQFFYEDCILYHQHKVNLERYESGNTLGQGFDCRKVSLQSLVFDNPIVGSCNGLVCLLSKKLIVGYSVFIVCNPVTGEYVHIGRDRRLHPKGQDPVDLVTLNPLMSIRATG
ncbi:hypothetical protein C5167_029989 [Papaver somniferum]|nr:hypothetical protein C5167_029989 [Papaver somniferum]